MQNTVYSRIDNKPFFDSMGLKSFRDVTRDSAARGRSNVIKVMQRYAAQKKALSGPDSISIGRFQFLKAQRPIQHMMAFLPDKPSIGWSGGDHTALISYPLQKTIGLVSYQEQS